MILSSMPLSSVIRMTPIGRAKTWQPGTVGFFDDDHRIQLVAVFSAASRG